MNSPIRLSILLLSLVCLLTTGCGAPYNVVYNGARRGLPEVGLVRGSNVGGDYNYATAQIKTVDGVRLDLENMKANTVEVLPGKHRFGVGIYTPNQSRTTTIELNVEAGKVYEVRFSVDEPSLDQRKLLLKEAHLFETTAGERLMTLDSWGPIQNAVWKLPPIIINR